MVVVSSGTATFGISLLHLIPRTKELQMDKGNFLSLPTAATARQHLDTKKKSDSRNVHPGYSMFEWNVLCDSGQDLSGVGGKLRKVTLEELEKHSTETDAWTAVRGKVYNITHFMKFHPGGKGQLMRGAGNDCTELFDKIHVWVSSEHILEKCLVGVLDAPKHSKQTSQTLSVGGLSATTTAPPVKAGGELSLPVPAIATPQSAQSEEDALSLGMLRQAKIQSKESMEEVVSVPVPSWIKPSEPNAPVADRTSRDDLGGSSVDSPISSNDPGGSSVDSPISSNDPGGSSVDSPISGYETAV